jgi:uncharacterized protein
MRIPSDREIRTPASRPRTDHSKRTPPVFVSGDSFAAAVRRWGEDKVMAFGVLRKRYGDPALSRLSQATGHAVI